MTLAGEALSNWGHGNVGLVADRKLQDDASANSDHTDSNQFAGYSRGTLISRFKRWCTLIRRVTLGRSSTMGAIVLLSGMMLIGTSHHLLEPHIESASWCVERNHVYTLRSWISDLIR